MPTVFISHSTADDDAVTALAGELTAAGITVWVDHLHGITPGDRFHKAIQEAVTAADAGLFILSPDSADSAYCEAEWTRILDLKKTLYVALLRTLPTATIPLRLGTIHRVDLIRDRAAAVKALTEAILGGREMERADAAETAHISGSFPASQLDLPLIGREREFQAAQESLQTQRVTAILGLGGVGKTRLAAEIARTSRAPGGTVWHTIQPYTTVEQLTLAVRDHLRLPLTAEDEAIWAAAGSRGVLIVLDNGEACAAPAAYAERINRLDTSQGARALLTSRAAWRELRGVKAFDLAAPDLPSAEAILKAMLAAEPPVFPADGHERELAEAARRHPRLMLYAVGWLNTYPIEAVLEMARTLKGADAEEALDDLIHKTIRQMEAQPGGAEARAALRRLAVCRGGFTLEAAKAIMGGEVTALGPLMRWRLVTSDGRRYNIDPLVIEAVGEDETAHRPHYAFYEALANEHDRQQDYRGLDPESANLEAAFEWAMRTEQYADAYWLYTAVSEFLPNRGRFAQRMDWLERAAAAILPPPDATTPPANPALVAAVHNSLGILYKEHPLGDRRQNDRHAIAAYQAALVYSAPEVAPLNYAVTQNNLGIAYRELSEVEDQEANLRRAIAAFEAALVYSTPEAAPLFYAMTMNNLGSVYCELAALEDGEANLRRAIAAFEAALVYYTPEAAPLDYAGTLHNLGIAYDKFSEVEDASANLRRAIAAYEATLVYSTPEAAPLNYAATQNNLGLAYSHLAALENREANLRRAIAAFEMALVYWTLETVPLKHAMTQNNLASAYRKLSELEDPATNLRRAIAAYEAALVYRTPEATPLNYAATQNNLGLAYSHLAALEDGEANLRRAIAAFEMALVYQDPQAAPFAYAGIQNTLGNAYSDLAALEDREANLHRAIAAFEMALVYQNPQAAPLNYAIVQNNLGAAYHGLSELKDRATNLRRAIAAFEMALVYQNPQAVPLDYAGNQNSLGLAYSDLAALENRGANLRRAIAAYRSALVYCTPEADPLNYSTIQNNLGNAYHGLSQWEDRLEDRDANMRLALAAFEVSLVYRNPAATPLDYARSQGNLGVALDKSGDLAGALACWHRAEPIYREMGNGKDADKLLGWIKDAESRLAPPPPTGGADG